MNEKQQSTYELIHNDYYNNDKSYHCSKDNYVFKTIPSIIVTISIHLGRVMTIRAIVSLVHICVYPVIVMISSTRFFLKVQTRW